MKKGLNKEIDNILFRMNFNAKKSLTEGFTTKYEKNIKFNLVEDITQQILVFLASI